MQTYIWANASGEWLTIGSRKSHAGPVSQFGFTADINRAYVGTSLPKEATELKLVRLAAVEHRTVTLVTGD